MAAVSMASAQQGNVQSFRTESKKLFDRQGSLSSTRSTCVGQLSHSSFWSDKSEESDGEGEWCSGCWSGDSLPATPAPVPALVSPARAIGELRRTKRSFDFREFCDLAALTEDDLEVERASLPVLGTLRRIPRSHDLSLLCVLG
jgi:hypothetical protein